MVQIEQPHLDAIPLAVPARDELTGLVDIRAGVLAEPQLMQAKAVVREQNRLRPHLRIRHQLRHRRRSAAPCPARCIALVRQHESTRPGGRGSRPTIPAPPAAARSGRRSSDAASSMTFSIGCRSPGQKRVAQPSVHVRPRPGEVAQVVRRPLGIAVVADVLLVEDVLRAQREGAEPLRVEAHRRVRERVAAERVARIGRR